MRGVCRSDPKFLAMFTSFRAGRFSARAEIFGGISQFKCEAFSGQNRNSWRYFPVKTRGVYRPEPKFLAIFTNLVSRSYSVRTEIPGGISQLKCEAFFSQNRNPRQYCPVNMRGVCRSEPDFPAVFSSLCARRYSVRTKTPGDISQYKCVACVGQNQNSWR